MPKTTRQMDALKDTFEKLYSAVQNDDLPGLLNQTATLIASVTGWEPAAKPDAGEGSMGPSYGPAYTAAAAMENIKAGYHYTGIRDGRRLSDEQLKEKEEGVAEAIAYFTAFGIPADMAEYGYRDGLTGFVGPRTFGSPGADLAEFVGKSLQTWLDQQWAIRAGGGKPSTGG